MELNIQTERLRLEPLQTKHLDEIFPFVANPEISKNMSWSAHTDKEETIQFLQRLEDERANGKNYTWAIYFEKKFVGIFSIISILRKHRSLVYDRGELAYWVGPEYQGKGIMTEAGKAIIKFAFENLNLHRLTVSHFETNDQSKNLILRLGFKLIGKERESFFKNGAWHNHILYDLLNSDIINTKHA
jgi:ribosomal-protein-alanine N-acetyltransferase